MNKAKILDIIITIFLGKRYTKLTSLNEQARYLTMNFVFMVAMIPLVMLGTSLIGIEPIRVMINYGIAFLCFLSLILMRTNIPLRMIPIIPVSLFGAFCVFLFYQGSLYLWAAVWLFTFPVIAIFLCQLTAGLIMSIAVFGGAIFIMFSSYGPYVLYDIRSRIILAYILIIGLAAIYERTSILKDRKERALGAALSQERDVIQTMKDNIQQGIFLMDKDMKILPQYSKTLITILSYYDSELAGKSFLDILAASLDVRQLQTMKGYFNMIFSKSKSEKVLEAANPIAEFEYTIDDRTKTLATKFTLIEQEQTDPVIIGIIQDISMEKEFQKELQAQREAQELEMKNMFDVIQVDPLVFQDFIDDTESNFNYINSILKDRSLTEKQVLIKFFQNVHAMKSNALILGLESFGKKLHTLEDDVQKISSQEKIIADDVLELAIKLEHIMKEKDTYLKLIKKVESFKSSNQIDSILIHSMTKAVEKISEETQKKVEIKAGQVDISILESDLRKPIKDILFQCIRNSIYHGIEPTNERIQKNKRPMSLLVFSIKKVDGNAEITFSDDGRGLDWDKIKARYLALHPTAKDTSKKVLLSSIFTPEFSTSEETTSVAGRGVGLSLVKDLVKENNGTIKVDTSESGLTFKFTFPLAS